MSCSRLHVALDLQLPWNAFWWSHLGKCSIAIKGRGEVGRDLLLHVIEKLDHRGHIDIGQFRSVEVLGHLAAGRERLRSEDGHGQYGLALPTHRWRCLRGSGVAGGKGGDCRQAAVHRLQERLLSDLQTLAFVGTRRGPEDVKVGPRASQVMRIVCAATASLRPPVHVLKEADHLGDGGACDLLALLRLAEGTLEGLRLRGELGLLLAEAQHLAEDSCGGGADPSVCSRAHPTTRPTLVGARERGRRASELHVRRGGCVVREEEGEVAAHGRNRWLRRRICSSRRRWQLWGLCYAGSARGPPRSPGRAPLALNAR
mmetsp:Transcript_7166/g.20779  ORF Transcript_7166/g.20779 Transcript_7166/m.20779 type:complete len:315 (+) Transcript_7166:259-1203(+)